MLLHTQNPYLIYSINKIIWMVSLFVCLLAKIFFFFSKYRINSMYKKNILFIFYEKKRKILNMIEHSFKCNMFIDTHKNKLCMLLTLTQWEPIEWMSSAKKSKRCTINLCLKMNILTKCYIHVTLANIVNVHLKKNWF